MFKIEDMYYLIGNIREDIKVHYWHSMDFRGPYEAFADNVLLPKGNYAVRIIRQEGTLLLWNFYISGAEHSGSRILPPPVELKQRPDGTLFLSSYSGFDTKISTSIPAERLLPLTPVLENPTAAAKETDAAIEIYSQSGYEIYFLRCEAVDFRMRSRVRLDGLGKFGIIIRSDEQASGYYISLDVLNGIAQVRFWGTRDDADGEDSFEYTELQDNHFSVNPARTHDLVALAWGGYLELSVDSVVVLRVVDTRFMKGTHIGFYVESARLSIAELSVEILDGPEEEDHSIV